MKKGIVIFLCALPVPVFILSLMTGPSAFYSLSGVFESIISWIKNSSESLSHEQSMTYTVLLDIRLPRILLAFMVGGALSVSGCALQAVFRNPLVSPYVLGLSSGAAFGAALALATSFLPVQLSAFIFGLLAVAMSFLIAFHKKTISVVSLILAGIITGGIFTALLTVVQFYSDPFKLQTIVHWTMGNMHNAGWDKVYSSWIPMTAGILILFFWRWRLNVLALGDDEARTSGLNPSREKAIVLVAATMASSAAVAVAGVIGLYGLIIPHMIRMITGPNNKMAVPMNFIFGGTFLLIIDDVSRTVSDFEIPIGIFTMLLGAPVFIYLLKKSKIGWA